MTKGSKARLGLVALLVVAPLAGVSMSPAGAQPNAGAVTLTKEITDYGKNTTRDATVRVNRTTNLFDRQQLEIDLEGFLPSYNANNTTVRGSRVEYPVVVMQCRGADPARTGCVTEERVQWQAGFDVNAPPEQRAVAQRQSRPGDPAPYPGENLDEQYANLFRAEQLPFAAAGGVSYLWVINSKADGSPYIDEPRLKSFPPTDTSSEGANTITTRNIPIRADGTNEFLFEVRQKASQSSLGCSDTEQCSIVVVPIMNMACVEDAPAECAAGPNGPAPGEPQFTDGHNLFLGPQQWLAESNWRNRIVVPLSFAPDLQSCSVRDSRPTVPTYGSELIDVAQQRWGAAYCTGVRPSTYLPGYTPGSEYFARRQLTTRLGASYQQDAVFVNQPVTDSPRPVGHAPAALSGFSVAYTVDDANGRQVTDLTLSPRLLAKLLTQSYNPTVVPVSAREGKRPYDGTQPVGDNATASRYYVAHPALLNNPRSLFADPEFEDLNPDLALRTGDDQLAGHLLTTLNPAVFTVESDVMIDLLRYVTSDPAARAFLDGQPDPHGTRVNPAWAGLEPTQLYTLLDTWVRPANPRRPSWQETNPEATRFFVFGGGDTCDESFQTPYLTKLGNITNSVKAAALTLLDRRGGATPICSRSDTPIPPKQQAPAPQFPGDVVGQDVRFTETKSAPNDFGTRATLAVTTVAHAALYEVPSARLVNSAGRAVAPTPGTMLGALNAAALDPASGTLTIDPAKVTGNAYPGTMVTYFAVPTFGLDATTAGRYADFMEFMATTGQVPGSTLANLPPGYDPLPPAMVRQALDVAAAVRAQNGAVPAGREPLGDGLPPAVDDVAANPGSGLPVTPAGNDTVSDDPDTVARTEGTSSWFSRWAIPLLLGLGLFAALAAYAVRIGAQPDHPLRRRFDTLLRAVGRR